ncbi:hypothetical protein BDF22DRAFT_683578 [Syncephalis plumigaleata]|nr:hypothetical protein BDF22DRAFT_683578 [Syncephalis plumigaleata]
MQNGAAGVVAIAAPWNQTGASPSASPSSAMPRLIRLGSLNTIPRQLDSSITSAAPWNRKFSHDDTEYRPRMSEETARMAADWRVESVGLSRSQSLMNREEQSVKATRVLPPVKANDRRKKLESITGSEADAPTPEAAANEPTSPKLSNDGSNGMNRTPEPVTVKKQLSAELLNILSETKSNEETQQPQYAGSAIAAVAMRVNGEHDTANSDPEAIRKPLVQAIALAGLRRKRTLEQLKQGQNEEETATTATIVEPDTSDITEKEAETEAITRGGNKEATKRKMTIDTKATVSTASVQQLATQHVHEIESPQPKPKTIALPTMNSLRSQLPIFSPLSPQIPITPYTGTSTPPANTSNVTDIPVFNDTSDILSSNASWRSRSADSSPVNLIHSTPIQSSKMITSMTSTLLTKPTTPTTATTTATTAYDGKDATGTDAETSSRALTGLLRHHRSQPGIRDSVLIRRTDSIAPRPTQAQLARARTIAHSPNNTFIARRNKARQAALDVSMPSSIASPTSILPEVGLVDVKVVLDKTRLIKVQIPRHITYDELRTRIDDKFKRCGHGDQATKDRILVYRESNADGAIVRIEGDFALGVVLFECPERVTFFAV